MLVEADIRARKVLMGTCGWSDISILRCGRFYPSSCRTAEDRLRHYSVEVDTSTYAIPTATSIARWLAAVPKGFIFHVKAFGLFPSKSCPLNAIPHENGLRSSLPAALGSRVTLTSLPPRAICQLWHIFNSRLLPLHESGALGAVVFQFHSGVHPTEEDHRQVEWCRSNLDARFQMVGPHTDATPHCLRFTSHTQIWDRELDPLMKAVEFRNRDWIVGRQLAATCGWLKSMQIALIAADDLRHEIVQPDRAQTGLNQGQVAEVLPIAWGESSEKLLYVRVHRREGNQRVLSETEMGDWTERLTRNLPTNLKGPVYFLWGTDHEDHPIRNAKRLSALLGEAAYDWKAALATRPKTGKLLGFFREMGRKESAEKDVVGKWGDGAVRNGRPFQEIENSGVDGNGIFRTELLGLERGVGAREESKVKEEMEKSESRPWRGQTIVAAEKLGGCGTSNVGVESGGVREGGTGRSRETDGEDSAEGLDEVKGTKVARDVKETRVLVRRMVPQRETAESALNSEHMTGLVGKRKQEEVSEHKEQERKERVSPRIASSGGVKFVPRASGVHSTTKKRQVQATSRPITSFFKSRS